TNELLSSYPFTAPAANPRTIPRWNNSVRTINGNVARVDAAAISPQGMVYSPGKRAMPTGKVCRLGSVSTMSAKKNSFQAYMKKNSAAVKIPGTEIGNTIL